MLSVFASHLRVIDGDFSHGLDFGYNNGIRSVEADSGEFNALPPLEYKALLDSHGMKMFSVHHITRLSASDPDIYAAALDSCFKAAEATALSGAGYFMLVPADPHDFSSPEDKIAARERIIAGMNKLAEFIKPLGLTMTIENFSKVEFPFSRADELMDMAENVDGLRLTLDSGNFYCIGENCIDGYDKIKSKLAFLHVKDWGIVDEGGLLASDGRRLMGCELGRGIVPIGELMARLRWDRFDGTIVIEQESTGGDMMADRLTAAVRLLSKII